MRASERVDLLPNCRVLSRRHELASPVRSITPRRRSNPERARRELDCFIAKFLARAPGLLRFVCTEDPLVQPTAFLVFLSGATRASIIPADLLRAGCALSHVDASSGLIVGQPPGIECDDPTGDVARRRRIERGVFRLRQDLVAAAGVGKRKQSSYRGSRFGRGVQKFLP